MFDRLVTDQRQIERQNGRRQANLLRHGSITLINDATLRIEACVLGILCGGENGVRAKWSEVLAARELGYVGARSDGLSRGGPMRAG